jgi:hypothetical protein
VSNGPWTEEKKVIVDVIDQETKKSLRQSDGSFLLEARRGQPKTVITVIGYATEAGTSSPYRNAWIYVDPSTIETVSLSKFAPGWAVNLQMSCRLVGDQLAGFEEAAITSLPMTVQPLQDAQNAEIQLQVMMTRGESVKGNAKAGMIGNYFERTVRLKVYE